MRDKRENSEWNEERICRILKKGAELEEIPQSLEPEQMKKRLEENEKHGNVEGKADQPEIHQDRDHKKKKTYHWWYGTAAAACLALVLLAAGRSGVLDVPDDGKTLEKDAAGNRGESEEQTGEADDSQIQESTTYEEIYKQFSKQWEEEEGLTIESETRGIYYNTDGSAEQESAASQENGAAKEDSSQAGAFADSAEAESKQKDYGRTNQQEQRVEEADIIKNDGRYLYQVVYSSEENDYSVQITDTKNGLKEKARVGKFDNIHEIYVWEDKLVVFETGYVQEQENEEEEVSESAIIQCDVAYMGNSFCMIHIYDIANRAKPKEVHTFHIKGDYRDSRIFDGYLYFFGTDYARKPEDEKDYKSYIPLLEEEPMEEERIYLPEDPSSNAYLIMASISMEEPDHFWDSKAIVTGASSFYVSEQNIYVTDNLQEEYNKEGKYTNRTKIYRFSYNNGKINREAEGSVKGILQDDMAMNEYQGHLRLVTTVDAYQVEKVTDDFWGEDMGYRTTDHETWNGLYILNEDLEVTGKIEDLAEDEEIYSARFWGDTGYFVTFRQMDPLFSVDLSDPKKPKVLGELKISGFSEYLHFYEKDLLLGIGMEADEEDGSTEGMKLSMFDISDPKDVREKSKLNLPEYDSSAALYNYKAVLIDTEKNLFGFLAEGYGEEVLCDYLLFTYEDGKFCQKMKIDCSDYDSYVREIRGTYIGDVFYLLSGDGSIRAYNLKDGSLADELKGE